MDIAKNLQQGTFDVTMSGLFTFNDHPEFREILQKMEESDVQNVVFHLEGLEFVDSAALGMFLLALDVAEKHQKRLVLQGAAGQVKKMFSLARFHTLFVLS